MWAGFLQCLWAWHYPWGGSPILKGQRVRRSFQYNILFFYLNIIIGIKKTVIGTSQRGYDKPTMGTFTVPCKGYPVVSLHGRFATQLSMKMRLFLVLKLSSGEQLSQLFLRFIVIAREVNRVQILENMSILKRSESAELQCSETTLQRNDR